MDWFEGKLRQTMVFYLFPSSIAGINISIQTIKFPDGSNCGLMQYLGYEFEA